MIYAARSTQLSEAKAIALFATPVLHARPCFVAISTMTKPRRFETIVAMRHNAPKIVGSKPKLLGKKIQASREAKLLNNTELAKLTGVHRSTIRDLENGLIRNPSPEILAKLAEHLNLTLADLYPLAGYAVPSALPDFDGYMATKFRGLPAEAIEEISGHVNYLAAKHGLDPAGPAPGEDER